MKPSPPGGGPGKTPQPEPGPRGLRLPAGLVSYALEGAALAVLLGAWALRAGAGPSGAALSSASVAAGYGAAWAVQALGEGAGRRARSARRGRGAGRYAAPVVALAGVAVAGAVLGGFGPGGDGADVWQVSLLIWGAGTVLRHPGPYGRALSGATWVALVLAGLVCRGGAPARADFAMGPGGIAHAAAWALGGLLGLSGLGVAAGRLQAAAGQARRLEVLQAIARRTPRPPALEALFEVVCEEIGRAMATDAFLVCLFEPQDDSVQVAFWVDRGRRCAPLRFPADRGPTVRVIRTGRPVWFRYPEERDRALEGARLVGLPVQPESGVIVPMALDGRVVGAISVQSYRPRAYTREDLELLEAVAAYVAGHVEQARLYGQAVQLSLTDVLTGLGNARLLQQELGRELARARRSGRPLALLMVDSDDLKPINDQFGHQAGDRYLTLLADVLRRFLRAGDVATRYAGDEFVILLPETGLEEATRVASRLCAAVAATPLTLEGRAIYTSVSVGVATFPGSGETEQELMEAVDRALYAAKRSGKGRIACHPPQGLPRKRSEPPPGGQLG